jgi:hypothetical protein
MKYAVETGSSAIIYVRTNFHNDGSGVQNFIDWGGGDRQTAKIKVKLSL